ncbi:MAG: GNAT family N-acetyltransferase [Hyphomicrobium sp.]|nr:MAG: GNAT family N-acetyltransferase [Hyphomicrobium sp.]
MCNLRVARFAASCPFGPELLVTASINPNFSVEIASTWSAVSDRWQALGRHAFASPFQTAHWIGNWYEAFTPTGIEPVIVSVVERSSGRDLMMIPLMRHSQNGVRRIEFADLWITDYNAPLVRSDYNFQDFAREVWPAILQALPPADVLTLQKMPLSLGPNVNPLTTLSSIEQSDLSGHIVALGDNWDEYLSTLSKSARRELRRRSTKFVNENGGRLRRIANSDEALEALQVLEAQQTTRLAAQGAKHVFNDPVYQELYRHHLLRGLENGHAVMFVLTADTEIVATFFALKNDDHTTLIRISQSQDPVWRPLGLGKMIIHQALEALHAEGCRTFDLSVGSHRYKDEFRVEPVPMAELTIPMSLRGTPFIARRKAIAYISRKPRLMALARSIADRLPRLAS